MTKYTLGKTESGKYPQIAAQDESAIIKHLSIYGFGDCINFSRKNRDGSTFGSNWGLGNLGCFRELTAYCRITDMPQTALEKLAVRTFELLYTGRWEKDKIDENKLPVIDKTNKKYKQILEELVELKDIEKRLVESKELVFPGISVEELACVDLW